MYSCGGKGGVVGRRKDERAGNSRSDMGGCAWTAAIGGSSTNEYRAGVCLGRGRGLAEGGRAGGISGATGVGAGAGIVTTGVGVGVGR